MQLYFRKGEESRIILDIQRSGLSGENTNLVEQRYQALQGCLQDGSFDIITATSEDEMVDKYHITYLEENTLEDIDKLKPQDLYMTWYPMAYGGIYKACYIKVFSTCPDTQVLVTISHLVAVSLQIHSISNQ